MPSDWSVKSAPYEPTPRSNCSSTNAGSSAVYGAMATMRMNEARKIVIQSHGTPRTYRSPSAISLKVPCGSSRSKPRGRAMTMSTAATTKLTALSANTDEAPQTP